jgi:hypothetical protein
VRGPIEVPLIVFVAVLLVFQADVMLEPGAKMSRHVPKLENEERASVLVVAPTVLAAATRAGDELHALVFELPNGDRVADARVDRVRDGVVE